MQQKLLVISEAAIYLGVSIDTVRRWDKAGLLHSTRPTGKARYFSVEELERIKNSPPGTPIGPRMPQGAIPATSRLKPFSLVITLGKLALVLLTVFTILFLLI